MIVNRSLTVFTLSFLAGIILVTNGAGILLMSGIILILLILALFILRKLKRMVAFGVVIGILLGSLCTAAKDLSYLNLSEGEIPLCTGVVTQTREYEGYTSSTVYLHKYRQKIKLTVWGDKKIKTNDLLEMKNLEVSVPDGPMNDGAFDYAKYLKSIGIKYSGFAYENDVRIYGSGGLTPFKQAREINSKINERITKVFGKNDVAGVIGGIFIGDKSLISDETYDYMRMAGISHIMSVSGLHIMLIVSACCVFCKSVGIRGRNERALIVSILIVFAVITGMSASVIRAAFMVILVFVALNRYRDNDSVTTLSFAALVLAVFNPYVIYHTGFQMSFLATFAIIVTVGTLTEIFESKMPKALSASVAVSVTAQMGIFPVIIYSNGYITTLTIFANLICVPLLTFVYAFAGIALVTSANPFVFIAKSLVKFIIFVSEKIALLEFNRIYITGGAMLIVSSIVISLAYMYSFSGKGRWKKGIAFLLSGIVVFGVSAWYNARAPKDFSVTYLNVGHGDCTLVRSPDGGNMLIDIGTEDMADSQVIPYLNRKGIRKIDCIVLSHFDEDHAGGFARTVNNFSVKEVIVPYAEGGENVKEICKENDIELRIVSKGSVFKSCGAEFLVLSPEKVFSDNSNDSSIIMKMVYNESTWLFTGDASLEVFENTDDLDADILKVSHHGDKKCTDSELVERVSPLASVISAKGIGGNGADPEVLELLSAKGRLFTTYEDKTISFICDENGGIYFGKNKEPIKGGKS